MKTHQKLIHLFLITSLICLLTYAGCVKAQTKIGNITIADSIAQKYFLYLYQHPDTLTREYVDGCGDEMEKEVKAYNEWLSKVAIRHIVVEITHPAEIDTVII